MTDFNLTALSVDELKDIVINKTNKDVYSESIDELGKRMSFKVWNEFCDQYVYDTKPTTEEDEEWICSCGCDVDPEDGICEQCGKQN